MKRRQALHALVALCLLLTGCAQQASQPEETAQPQEEREPVEKVPLSDINDRTLTDKLSLYEEYDPVEPVCFYITVVGGNEADGTNHTFEEVNSYVNLQGMTGVEKIYSECIFQVGDETGAAPRRSGL